MPTRRQTIAALAVLPWLAGAAPARKRIVLNSGTSGAQAWFWVAEERGFLADAHVALDYTDGLGAYTAAPRMARERFDVGYGDIHALIDTVARQPASDDLPIAVFMMFNASPSAIIVAADGPIRAPAQLAGRTVIGHATDVALGTFPAYAAATGLDPATVTVRPDPAGMADLIDTLLSGRCDGVFGYHSTALAAMRTRGRDAGKLRFLSFAPALPDFYGSALMVSRRLARDEPGLVSGLVRAVSRGVRATVADPDGAIRAVKRRDQKIVEAVELGRLRDTLAAEMSHPEGARIGIGAVDPARLARSIAQHARASGLPRTPAFDEVFTDRFLPPVRARERGLGSVATPMRLG